MHALAIVHIDPIPTALLNIEPLDHNVLYCTYNEKQRSENKRFGPIMHVLLCSSARAVEPGADVTSVRRLTWHCAKALSLFVSWPT